ncbi:aminotransferase class III-fold pyridoxal phosphate-dependent enzyme [Lachnospiraceae bacterium ZAX-1]
MSVASESVRKHKQYNLQSWSVQGNINPIAVERAEGIYVYDYEGNRYSDMSSQLVNLNLGHGNKEIADAIKKQVDAFSYMAPSFAVESRGDLAELLVGLMPDNIAKVFFVNGGADANENALKMARMFTGKHKIFSRYRSYHGSTYGAANLTGEPRRYPSEPGIPGFVKFFDPYLYREKIHFENTQAAGQFYVDKLREQIEYEGSDNVAAIVLETITGSNGIIIPPENYLPGVRKICDDYGILMICDEVMSGFGRTGKMFGFENYNIKPDIITFAKGVTCGYVPIGGVAVSKEIAAYFDTHKLLCGLTYSGHPLGCAAGIACVNYYLEHNVLDNVNKVGATLTEILNGFLQTYDCVGDVRNIGLFAAIELVKDKATKEAIVPYGKDPNGVMGKILGLLKERKFLTYTHENMIIVAPPLIITEEQIKEEMEKVAEVLAIIDSEIL